MERENLKSYLTDISHSVASVMVGFSHTLPCCLSKPRSSLEAAWKQLRVWLEYTWSMAEVFFYLFFGCPLVFPRYYFGDCEMVRSELEGSSGCGVLINMDENDCEVGFWTSRIYIHKSTPSCLSSTFFTIVR